MMSEPEVGGMRQEDYSKDWVMHIGKSDLNNRGITKTIGRSWALQFSQI